MSKKKTFIPAKRKPTQALDNAAIESLKAALKRGPRSFPEIFEDIWPKIKDSYTHSGEETVKLRTYGVLCDLLKVGAIVRNADRKYALPPKPKARRKKDTDNQ